MNILEIAKECGFKLIEFNGSKHTDVTSCTPVFTVELTRFAAAVIEDYKASLVPVAWVTKGTSELFLFTDADATGVFRYGRHGNADIPLYALPKETK